MAHVTQLDLPLMCPEKRHMMVKIFIAAKHVPRCHNALLLCRPPMLDPLPSSAAIIPPGNISGGKNIRFVGLHFGAHLHGMIFISQFDVRTAEVIRSW